MLSLIALARSFSLEKIYSVLMAALSSRFFLAFGAYGAEQKRVLLDEQNLLLVDALSTVAAPTP